VKVPQWRAANVSLPLAAYRLGFGIYRKRGKIWIHTRQAGAWSVIGKTVAGPLSAGAAWKWLEEQENE
jgi:hypothetical protein